MNDAKPETTLFPGPIKHDLSRRLWRLQRSQHDARSTIGHHNLFHNRRPSRGRHRILLRSTLTGATLNGTGIYAASLPTLFTANDISAIQVQASSNTIFENVPGVSGLADSNTLSVRGLLFITTPNPVLVAGKVRKS